MQLNIETKSVPSRTIKDEVDKHCKDIENTTGRKPGKMVRRELSDEVLKDMLPAAFPKLATVTVWIDPVRALLVIGATGNSKTDTVISALVQGIPGLQLRMLNTILSPRAAMTQWLLDADTWPGQFRVGRECALERPNDGARIRFVRHDLMTNEMREHITAGNQPTQLAMDWSDKASFVLTDTLALKKIELLGDELSASPHEDRFDADVAIATGTLGAVIDELIEALGGEYVAPVASAD